MIGQKFILISLSDWLVYAGAVCLLIWALSLLFEDRLRLQMVVAKVLKHYRKFCRLHPRKPGRGLEGALSITRLEEAIEEYRKVADTEMPHYRLSRRLQQTSPPTSQAPSRPLERRWIEAMEELRRWQRWRFFHWFF